ncbi:hypothetical protein [uncultured Bifidobacterium sp.]|uniref:hypothetical protein n=1 Tax=uncultured Bifidobacterium sp. TaxID=165187 RepID=UPI0028DC5C92|nr:hypothetical protein [uncultured Bifidobacterium sp.]
MAVAQRSIRSHAAPAGRPDDGEQRSIRPNLKVSRGGRRADAVGDGFRRLLTWTRSRRTPLIHLVLAVVFLVSSLVGSLMFRTRMVENAFEQTQIESRISELTQDVQTDQAALDDLETSLPQKAEKMGMEPASSSVTIDLNGYKASDGESK